MSNLECIGLCCFACIVPTAVLGALFFIVGAFFFYIYKLFGCIYSKKSLYWKCVKTLCIQTAKLTKVYYCRVTKFINKTYEEWKKSIRELLEKVKIKLFDFKKEVMAHKEYYGKIAILAFVMLTSIVIQILIEFGKFPCPIYVDDLNDISIAVVTIQATLFTLVISLLALVTNNDKVYFGFEIKDFYFNHGTVFLKQKTMMYVGIGLILLNIMFLYFDLHNMIYAVFFISLWFIFESARNVMRIFAGKDENYIEDVIDYIYECLEKNRTVKSIYDNFTNDWCKKIRNHDSYNEKLYYEIHCKIRMHMIKNR